MLQLLGMLALEEANTLLTPRPPAEGYNPKVTEGMWFGLHPIFSLLGDLSASFSSWYSVSDGISFFRPNREQKECHRNFIEGFIIF